ncbi:MAG: RNA chaperone Hfq [Terracidiphilus sp.]|jgi:host factor-I protein
MSKRRSLKTPPPGETGQEALYLRSLSDRQVNVQIKLRDGETVRGWIEYFDDGMLRLTREGKPNLFIYKHQIRTITEVGKLAPRRAKTAVSGVNGLVANSENGDAA